MTPDKFTIEEKMVEVGNGHSLYVQLWGNRKAKHSIVFLHGGPGSGCKDGHKSIFNPKHQKVLFIDQRGSGNSLYKKPTWHNKTSDLVEDINKVTKVFGIKKFVITGGSWGSTLALAYAIKHPSRVSAMVLRGIFTGRDEEVDYFENGQTQTHFPDSWEEYQKSVPAKFRDNPRDYHLPRILGKDQKAAKKSAFAYNQMVGATIGLDDRVSMADYEEYDPTSIIIEVFYLENGCFMPKDYIMKNAGKLKMPIDIVQGRYDFICPPFTAWQLHNKLPNSRLHWTIAGHSGSDRNTFEVTKALLSQF